MDKQCVPEPKYKQEVHWRSKQEQTTCEEYRHWMHTDDVNKNKTDGFSSSVECEALQEWVL